ncbi:MAG TPA: SapC family protein [Burkholderiales bacterium]|nr:SapC family protein [Burkholderiales bacterium]
MDIKPPYGYQEIVPLTRSHRVRLPLDRTLPTAFQKVSAVPLSFTEFASAACDYPIAFITGDGGKSFVAMAVLGIENQQNLFVGRDSTWDSSVYLPAYVRRYPFCMSRVSVNGAEQAERIACVEKSAIDNAGEALFDAKGEPLPLWTERRKLLFEYEADLARTDEMTRALGALNLLEPFTMQAVPKQGTPLALTGLHRVSEQKLHDLPAEKLKELAQSGRLARVYAHLISLHNFARLLDRRARMLAASSAPARSTH